LVVVLLSNLYQLPLPTPPIRIFPPSFYRNHKASCTTPERRFFKPLLAARTLRLARLEATVQINMAEKQLNALG
jgi:hypothetical protein